MKKFKFSLEKVLSLREFEEKQAQIELGKAQSVVNDLNEQLKFIASERLKSNESRSKSSDLTFLMSIENYINGLDYKKEKLIEELAQAQIILEEKRAIVVEAIKKRKSLEKLKEKQFESYKKEYNKEEEKILDEISICACTFARFINNRKSEISCILAQSELRRVKRLTVFASRRPISSDIIGYVNSVSIRTNYIYLVVLYPKFFYLGAFGCIEITLFKRFGNVSVFKTWGFYHCEGIARIAVRRSIGM